jgi:hypothetical protein
LPHTSVYTIFEEVHSKSYGGHLGRLKTYRKIAERFYIQHLKQEIYELVKTCDICRKIKASHLQSKAELNPILPTKTNEFVAADWQDHSHAQQIKTNTCL